VFQANGYYRKTWTNSAAGNLQRQVPHISVSFPEIRTFHPATINVRFEPKIIAACPDHRTPPLRWDDLQPEVFDLVRVRLCFEGRTDWVRALLYVPHRSAHRNDPHKHEFLGECFVNNLRDGMGVIMECDRQAIELPYEDQMPGGGGRPRLARTIVIL
jgi:hypothetical protein